MSTISANPKILDRMVATWREERHCVRCRKDRMKDFGIGMTYCRMCDTLIDIAGADHTAFEPLTKESKARLFEVFENHHTSDLKAHMEVFVARFGDKACRQAFIEWRKLKNTSTSSI